MAQKRTTINHIDIQLAKEVESEIAKTQSILSEAVRVENERLAKINSDTKSEKLSLLKKFLK